MAQEVFKAGVQYGDFKGTAAADHHDKLTLRKYLEDNNLMNSNESLVGVEMWSGEVQGPVQDAPVYVTAIVATAQGYDNIKQAVETGNPLQVRKVEFDLPLNQFFGFFKRFSIAVSSHGIIDGKDISF